MKKVDFMITLPFLVLIVNALPHCFQLPTKRIVILPPLILSTAQATTIVSVSVLFIVLYNFILQEEKFGSRIIVSLLILYLALTGYEAVYCISLSLFLDGYFTTYSQYAINLLLIVLALIISLFVLHLTPFKTKCRININTKFCLLLMFELILTFVFRYWFSDPLRVDSIESLLHKNLGMWMWIGVFQK